MFGFIIALTTVDGNSYSLQRLSYPVQQKIFIEYIMLDEVNDKEPHGHQLGKLLETSQVTWKNGQALQQTEGSSSSTTAPPARFPETASSCSLNFPRFSPANSTQQSPNHSTTAKQRKN